MTDSQALRQLQVYRYPFSTATSSPKIPDGKLTQSYGQKFNHAITITGVQQYLVLAPCFDTFWIGFNNAENSPHQIHQVQHELSQCKIVTTEQNVQYTGPAAIGKWRIVSKSMKIRNINSDDENDGYWEAVRIPANNIHRMFSLDRKNSPTEAGTNPWVNRGFGITHEFKESLKANSNWLMNASYCSGKVKNLSQYEFKLSPQVLEHNMLDIPKYMEWKVADYTAVTEANVGQEEIDGKDLSHLFKWGIDNQWDIVIIKLTGIDASKYLVHTVMNVEYQMREDSKYSTFQTECCQALTGLGKRQQAYKKEERLAGRFVGGPRNS